MTVLIATVIFIIIVSVFLIITEIFFIPGTTIFGIVGGLALAGGYYIAFTKLGMNWGYGSVGLSIVAFGIFFAMGRKMTESGTFTLKGSLTGRVNELEVGIAEIGQEGKTTGDLRPNGKAIINNKKIEVYSTGGFIEKDSTVVVTKIDGNKIYVKQLNS